MHFVVREAVAQEDHALTRIVGVLAVRISLHQRLERLEGFARVDRRALREIGIEPALEEIRIAFELDQSLDVVGVVDARMRRVLADELVRLVDRGFRFAILVVGVHQVELPLARRIAERKARFELLVVRDRVAIVAVVGGLLAIS